MSAAEVHFDSVDEAIAEIATGRIVVVTDDEDRENEGDLVMAASKATPEMVNMMIRHARGLICVPTTDHQLRRLGLGPMVAHNRESQRTAFMVSVDAADGITTGISAYDRCAAIRIIADPAATPDQLVQPGHVFPLRARPGGVLERAGHTEAAVDLAILAGLHPSGVICEVLNEDGSMARLPELTRFKKEHGLKMISIAQLIEYRHQREQLVERVVEQPFANDYGNFTLHIFRSRTDASHHFALTLGDLDESPTLVRVHSENLLSDLFREAGTHGNENLSRAMQRIAAEGRGVLLYMTHECGGVVIPSGAHPGNAKVGAANMDFRRYGIGAQILKSLGLGKIRLLSSTSRNVVALEGFDLEIVEQLPL